ncbi:TonB-dependent receptor plug domain-containing protein [Zunongwangia endophytica]|uniref:TonB-dependent receptor plug domain-containing protein n=1 Tax=Zunongwangia endophytica TaxID=1808945 RepID=A0ABV8H733_9FLAO|nr:TonB-dependent receptor [Zunongwangia endophytica]MDN3593875.1 TonB-dependent receptor [Zunongwangia endophytica]
MKKQLLFLIVAIGLFSSKIFAQSKAVTVLDTVLLTDEKLEKFSTGQHVAKLSDSLLTRNQPLLTEVLSFNTPIYFKENGLGMVSSPSFRGTSASQTAVIWNGININSQFNGQLDFNTVNTGVYDQISVRGGGGSVVYGTGAIGGSVHLNNSLSFKKQQQNHLLLRYGSFNTLDARYNLKLASEKWSLNLAISRNSSDNDYEYPDDRGKNLNGEFYNTSANVALGYRFDSKNSLKLVSEVYDGERHFSIIRPSENRTKYIDRSYRNLLQWNSEFSKFTQVTRLAFIEEKYKYFGNIKSENFTFGNAQSYIAKYDLGYEVSNDLLLNAVIQNTYTEGEGSSIEKNERNIFSAAFLMKHALTEKIQYEIGIRKESTNNYDSPLLYSFGADYKISDFYTLKFNGSRNFRIPTYNDLYWASSGNPDLHPETSDQAEIGNIFSIKNIEFGLTFFYNQVEDMIRWLPGEGGVWRPINEDEVRLYGIESYVNWHKKLSKNQVLHANLNYAYNVSENSENNRQLMYVPFHKLNGNITYQINRFTPSLQFLYNGKVFTRSDHSDELEGYFLTNLGLSYAIDKRQNWQLGGKINNIFNTEYQNVESRWMPGINFNIYLNFKF